MGKLLLFPGVDLDPPSRIDLVAEASEIIVKEVVGVFIEKEFEPGPLGPWHQAIRDYFWRIEIKLVDRDFRSEDLRKWKAYWRDQAIQYIASKRAR